MKFKQDCFYFKGDIPCSKHKEKGFTCDNCKEYKPIDKQILIIKLGAAGDVLRTTTILEPMRKENPNAHITWITKTKEFVPSSHVNKIIEWNWENVLWLSERHFDIVYSLDKDKEAIALAKKINTDILKGYTMDYWGNCVNADSDSYHKWSTGIDDNLTKDNKKSYPEEIVELCGYKYTKQKYIMKVPPKKSVENIKKQIIVGLNTGCGTRWQTRLWGNQNWIDLAQMLIDVNIIPILLGGPYEDKNNRLISSKSGARYYGTMSITKFIQLVDNCDLVVTSVTMAMHVTIALGKKIVLLNNIFNKHEFELYNLGEIIEPDKNCKCCYKNSCEESCMETIKPKEVFDSISRLLRI